MMRCNWLGLLISSVVMAMATTAFVPADEQNDSRTEQLERIANARRLAAESRELLPTFPIRGLLLAIEAVRLTVDRGESHVTAAQTALQDALSSIGGRSLGPLGWHAWISSDSRWLATGNRIWDLTTGDPTKRSFVLSGHETRVKIAAFSPDCRQLITVSDDRVLRWNLTGATPVASILAGPAGGATTWASAAYSPNGRWLVAGARGSSSDSQFMRIWNFKSGRRASKPPSYDLRHPKANWLARFSPDNRWLATAGEKSIRLWDLTAKKPGQTVRELSGHKGYISSLVWSPNSNWLASADRQGSLLWQPNHSQIRSLDLESTPKSSTYYHRYLHFTPDSQRLVMATEDRRLRMWDLSVEHPAKSRLELHEFPQEVRDLSVSPDSRWVMVTPTSNPDIHLWDLQNVAAATLLRGHQSPVVSAAMGPNSRWAATADQDGTVRLWNLRDGHPASNPRVLPGHDGRVDHVAFSSDGERLISTGIDRTIRCWDLTSPSPATTATVLRGYESSPRISAWSPNGRWLAASGRLWDLDATDQTVSPLVLPGARRSDVRHLFLDDDAKRLVTCGAYDRVARFWKLSGPSPTVVDLGDFEKPIQSVAISRDQRWLAVGSRMERHGLLWDLNARDAAKKYVLEGHSHGVSHLEFTPDNRWLLSGGHRTGGSLDPRLLLWDINADNPAGSPRRLKGSGASLRAARFSRDGRWLMASGRSAAQIWDLHADNPSRKLVELDGHGRIGVKRHGISPDGHWAFTIEWDNHQLRLWDLTRKDPAAFPELLGEGEGDARFTADSRWLVARNTKTTAKIWDLRSERSPRTAVELPHFGYGFYSVAFSHTGRWLLATDTDKKTRLWDLSALPTSTPALIIDVHERGVYRRLFSKNDHWLVTGGNGYSAPRLWNLNVPDSIGSPVKLPGNVRRVEHFRFSDDGRWLATSDGQTLHVWDLRAEEIPNSPLRFRVPGEYPRSMQFSRDGRTLVCGYRGGTTRLWSLDLKSLVEFAEHHAGRELTDAERLAHDVPRRGVLRETVDNVPVVP